MSFDSLASDTAVGSLDDLPCLLINSLVNKKTHCSLPPNQCDCHSIADLQPSGTILPFGIFQSFRKPILRSHYH